jgi:hypothetical protein
VISQRTRIPDSGRRLTGQQSSVGKPIHQDSMWRRLNMPVLRRSREHGPLHDAGYNSLGTGRRLARRVGFELPLSSHLNRDGAWTQRLCHSKQEGKWRVGYIGELDAARQSPVHHYPVDKSIKSVLGNSEPQTSICPYPPDAYALEFSKLTGLSGKVKHIGEPCSCIIEQGFQAALECLWS